MLNTFKFDIKLRNVYFLKLLLKYSLDPHKTLEVNWKEEKKKVNNQSHT